MFKEILDTPEEIVEKIMRRGGIYVIKVKCLACSEGSFIPYVPPVIDGGKLIIGRYSYPVELVEMVTIRYKYIVKEAGDMPIRGEVRYKVSSLRLNLLLSAHALERLKEFELI